MKLRIKKGATVEVITGSDKGKKGTVLNVDPIKMRVRVQGVKMQTRHSKKDGLKQAEGTIHYSNLRLVEGAKAEKKKSTKKSASAE